MALDIKQLNTDTSFLLSFEPISPELAAAVDVVAPRPFTILLDPVIKNPPSFSVLTPTSTTATTATDADPPTPPATNDGKFTLTSLRELPEDPDLIIISQAGPDHCDETTLRQLRRTGTRTLIIAEPAAAHKIHSWHHFDRDKVRIVEPWEDPRLAVGYRAVVARVVVPAVRVMSGVVDANGQPSSKAGQPGEVTVSLVMPETNTRKNKKQQAQTQAQMQQQQQKKLQQLHKQKKHKRRGSSCGLSPGAAAAQAAAGIAGVIGITYRPPTIPGLEPLRIPVLAERHLSQSHGAVLHAAPPMPAEAYGNSNGNGEGSSNNAPKTTKKTLSVVAPDAESVLSPTSPPISPQSLRSVQSHAVLSNSSPMATQPPFLTSAAYSHTRTQRPAPPPPPSPAKPVPSLTQEQLDKERQKQRPTSYFYKPRPPSSALSTTTTASTTNRSSNTNTNPTSWASAGARMAAAKKAAAAAARPLSVVYAPHGTAFPHLAAWTSSHLVQEAALPLTALLHPMDGVVLGAVARARIQAALQQQGSGSGSNRPASSSSSTSSWSSWSSTLGRTLGFGGGNGASKAATAAAAAAASTRSSVVCAGAEIASRMAARAWVSVNDGGAARGSRRWARDEPAPSLAPGSADRDQDPEGEEKRLSARSSSKRGDGAAAAPTAMTKVLRLGSGNSVTVCADEVLRPDWAEDDYMEEEMDDDEEEEEEQQQREGQEEEISFANTTVSFANSATASLDQKDDKKKLKPKTRSSLDIISNGNADGQNDFLMKTKSKTQQVSVNEQPAAAPIAPGTGNGNSNEKENLAPPLKKKRGLRTKASFMRLGLGKSRGPP